MNQNRIENRSTSRALLLVHWLCGIRIMIGGIFTILFLFYALISVCTGPKCLAPKCLILNWFCVLRRRSCYCFRLRLPERPVFPTAPTFVGIFKTKTEKTFKSSLFLC
ncbi:hypothetical protein VNO77_04209 [Canavalia gladiata]|uniref:Uncharacterized protein n=1 Tax=Canavalia gladiata TaxID=3824 RepID=A0AAN9N1S8_CANGL